MAVLYERSPVAGIVSQPLLKEDLYRSAPRLPGQSVDLTAVAEMNCSCRAITAQCGRGSLRHSPCVVYRRNYRRDRIHYHPDRTIASGMGATVLPNYVRSCAG